MPESASEIKFIPVRYDFPEEVHVKLTRYQRIVAALLDKPLTQEEAIIHLIKTTELPVLLKG